MNLLDVVFAPEPASGTSRPWCGRAGDGAGGGGGDANPPGPQEEKMTCAKEESP